MIARFCKLNFEDMVGIAIQDSEELIFKAAINLQKKQNLLS